MGRAASEQCECKRVSFTHMPLQYVLPYMPLQYVLPYVPLQYALPYMPLQYVLPSVSHHMLQISRPCNCDWIGCGDEEIDGKN